MVDGGGGRRLKTPKQNSPHRLTTLLHVYVHTATPAASELLKQITPMRSETPDDIFSAIVKEEIVNKVDDAGNEIKEDDIHKGRDSERNEDDVDDRKDDEQSRSEDGRRTESGKRQQPRRHVSNGYHLVEGKMEHIMENYHVLCRNGAASQLTGEHEPLKDKNMVESKGGFVSHKPVDDHLAMTRAFRDERLKDHITAEPDIAMETIDEDTEFIILASDGLWKVMSNQEAVDCIRGLNDGREAAEELIKDAPLRESKDDICFGVVIFYD